VKKPLLGENSIAPETLLRRASQNGRAAVDGLMRVWEHSGLSAQVIFDTIALSSKSCLAS
jgi:hypothetical protein